MEAGTLLNKRYQLLEQLGTGGMSNVFRARDLMLERNVAIKVLHEQYSKDQAFQERFRQEARAAANLSHPNIVTVHDFGFDFGQLFIVMEYVPGRDLKTILRQRGRYTVDEAIPLIVQACAGIGYAHRAGPHWVDWLRRHAGELRKAPKQPGSRRHKPIEAAPGRYVKEKA